LLLLLVLLLSLSLLLLLLLVLWSLSNSDEEDDVVAMMKKLPCSLRSTKIKQSHWSVMISTCRLIPTTNAYCQSHAMVHSPGNTPNELPANPTFLPSHCGSPRSVPHQQRRLKICHVFSAFYLYDVFGRWGRGHYHYFQYVFNNQQSAVLECGCHGCDLVDLVIAVMAIQQCGLVAASAWGILMLIIIARSRLFTWWAIRGASLPTAASILWADRSKMLISYDQWQWLTQLLMH
jgi:hypothetical protein